MDLEQETKQINQDYYINNGLYNVPENTIVVVPFGPNHDGFWSEIIEPLNGKLKRDWFNSHFYYCLPLIIGNQYGFAIKSLIDFDMHWSGDPEEEISIKFLDNEKEDKLKILTHFKNGILTIQPRFYLKTPPNVNIMTIQPPNSFIPGCAALTGVIETDNIRRDFTFNLKITVPHYRVRVRKGDYLGAFIPIPRYYVDNYTVKFIDEVFPTEVKETELAVSPSILQEERLGIDQTKPHASGRRYFNGLQPDDTLYKNHQKRMNPPS